MRRLNLAGIALALAMPLAASAEPGEPPALGAASRFGQTWAPALLDAAEAAGILGLRDEIHWDAVEAGGGYRFETFLTTYPALMGARGMGLTLLLGGAHPDHDAGQSPWSPEARAAFARFAAASVAEYPAITAVEVGNEANGTDFLTGPALGETLAARAEAHAALLAENARAVRAARPGVTVIGGGALGVPLGWLAVLAEAGAPAHMDALALHPYTTPPEQLARQLALVRDVPGFDAMPIALTEVGTSEIAAAPGYLIRSVCQAALAGVERLDWYPLGAREDGFAPLIDATGGLTPTGQAFVLAQTRLASGPVRDVAPDPFTYACAYGDDALVIWGAERGVRLAEGLTALDATGAPVAAPRLGAAPLVIVSDGPPVRLGETVTLGPQTVLADSFDQFAYPGQPGGGFDVFARAGGARIDFLLGPGQEENGTPWTPYLRSARDGMLRLDAGFLMPSVWEEGPAEIVHAWTAEAPDTVELVARFTPEPGAVFPVEVRLNGQPISTCAADMPQTVRLQTPVIPGDVIEIVTGPGRAVDAPPDGAAGGRATGYRFTLSRLP